MSPHAKRALVVIGAAFTLDVVGGWLFSIAQHIPFIDGIYYALTTASTVGYGDITPANGAAKIITVVMELTVIPLFAAAYSLMTAGLTTERIKNHIDKRVEELGNDDS